MNTNLLVEKAVLEEILLLNVEFHFINYFMDVYRFLVKYSISLSISPWVYQFAFSTLPNFDLVFDAVKRVKKPSERPPYEEWGEIFDIE